MHFTGMPSGYCIIMMYVPIIIAYYKLENVEDFITRFIEYSNRHSVTIKITHKHTHRK